MARIDSILSIVVHQAANELRVGTDREPKILAHGQVKRFTMPATGEETLRELLGEILGPERDDALVARGRVELDYTTESGVGFRVGITRRPGGGFDAVFVKSVARASTSLPTAARASVTAAVAPAIEAPPSGDLRVALPVSTFTGSDLVQRAIASRATDLHLVDGGAPVMRIDGRLVRDGSGPIDDVLAAIGLDGARGSLERGVAVEMSVEVDVDRRARVHAYRAATGAAVAIRFFAATPSGLASLNLPVPLDGVIDLPHGLVLVCGATGSGKSTTLAALAQEALRRRSIVLVTLEDPIEYTLSDGDASIVRQRQVGRDVSDFASGLRDALREDPDVILVGELRDAPTIALALTAAETGHLVIATLHSGGVASAVERIVDSVANEKQAQIRSQLAGVLRVVIAQRLLPRVRGSGRLPAVEVLRVNHAAASLIRDGKTVQLSSVLQSGRREGMITLERSLADRVNAGEVRLDHARAAANDAEALAMCLTRA